MRSENADAADARSFNFTYSDDQAGLTPIPSLEIRDEMRNLTLTGDAGSQKRKRSSIGEVKRQVQVLVKQCVCGIGATNARRIIAMTQALDELPRRRYVTMKLYYHVRRLPACSAPLTSQDHTPRSYEPPLFASAKFSEVRRFSFYQVDGRRPSFASGRSQLKRRLTPIASARWTQAITGTSVRIAPVLTYTAST